MSFSNSFLKNDRSRPAENELEVSVFGGGVGECIVVHLAANRWFVVDSFLWRDSARPVAMEYLEAIGVDVATQVHQVVVTHWHDDHIKGASAVFDSCTGADLICSSALSSKEFLRLMTLQNSHGSVLTAITTGVDEFSSLIRTALDRKKVRGRLPIQFAQSCKILFAHQSASFSSSVTALSPSDAEFFRALTGFQRLFPTTAGSPKTRLPDTQPNDTAVVLWLAAGSLSVLLGSDLERTSADDTGWGHIVSLQTRPAGRACVFKIPHHGSNTGYDARVWNEMLGESPYALLTPFTRCNLPREAEVTRILSHTPHAYGAGDGSSKRLKRESKVDKILKEKTKTRRTLDGKLGLVRIRMNIEEPHHRLDLFGSSCHLSDLSLTESVSSLAPTGT